jgi:polyhydroxyalkanoate synthase
MGQGLGGAAGADPASVAFSDGQALYKTNLLNTLNLFRAQAGHQPLSWPTRGATPTTVEVTDGPVRLVRYEGRARGAPVLMVCSLVNRPYVLDILHGRSVVESLQRGGRDVWLLDWGTPERADDARGLEHWALGLIPKSLDFVRAHTGEVPHLLGYCMGGTLSLIALAAGAQAKSLIAMATPVDLHDDGLLSLWTRAPGFDPRMIVDTYGHAPPHL